MTTKAELRKKIQTTNKIIKLITADPKPFVEYHLGLLKDRNTKLVNQIKELGY